MIGIMTIFLTGCLGTPEPVIQTKIVYVDKKILVSPPKHLLESVDIPKPPNKEVFIHTDNVTRLNMISKYTISLLKALGDSNAKIKAIHDWSSSMDKVYNDREDYHK